MNASHKKKSAKHLSKIAAIVIAVAVAIWYFSGNRNQDKIASANKVVSANGATATKNKKAGHHGRSFSPVQVEMTHIANIPRYLTGLGTVTAANTVTVRSRVEGQLMQIHFTEGQQVKAGDLLVEIDPRPFQVQLKQAEGTLTHDQAILENAKRDLARYQKLIKTNMISHQELDNQNSLVTQSKANIVTDHGTIDNAKLQITYSRITAPISGRVGLKRVDVGNYITSGDSNGLVVLTQTHPIDVIFTLPEADIPSIQKAQKSSNNLQVEAWDRNNKNLLATGSLLSLDNQIDSTTGTIRVKARFQNQDDALFPNQFVNIRLKVDTESGVIVAPVEAIQLGNEGHFVWVLNDKNQVSKRLVSTGTRTNSSVVITSGLSAGERVVIDGIDQLTEGAQVDIVAGIKQADTGQKQINPDQMDNPNGPAALPTPTSQSTKSPTATPDNPKQDNG